jgi:hypothetical protein
MKLWLGAIFLAALFGLDNECRADEMQDACRKFFLKSL